MPRCLHVEGFLAHLPTQFRPPCSLGLHHSSSTINQLSCPMFLSCPRTIHSLRVTSGFPRSSRASQSSEDFLCPCLLGVPILRLRLLNCISSHASFRKPSWLVLPLRFLASFRKPSWLVLPLRFLDARSTSPLITGRSVHAILCHHLSLYDVASFCLSQRPQGLWDLILPGGSFDPTLPSSGPCEGSH